MQGCNEKNKATKSDLLELFSIRLIEIKIPIEGIRRCVERLDRLIEIDAPLCIVAREIDMIRYRALDVIGKYDSYQLTKEAKDDADKAKYAADFAKEINQTAPEESTGMGWVALAEKLEEEAKAIRKKGLEESAEWGFTAETAIDLLFPGKSSITDTHGIQWLVDAIMLNGNQMRLLRASDKSMKTITQQDYKKYRINFFSKADGE